MATKINYAINYRADENEFKHIEKENNNSG
jgi:hypothetical protein